MQGLGRVSDPKSVSNDPVELGAWRSVQDARRARAAEVAKELASAAGVGAANGRRGRGGGGGRRPERSGGLQAMAATANATLEAIQRTVAALADVEAAAAAVERAKGHVDDLVGAFPSFPLNHKP